MPQIAYMFALDSTGLNWLRFELMIVGGQVISFVAQYETTFDGKLIPVIHYDNHHGFCHRDRMNRRGDVVEKLVVDGLPGEVATFSASDIKANWRAYRTQFLGSSE